MQSSASSIKTVLEAPLLMYCLASMLTQNTHRRSHCRLPLLSFPVLFAPAELKVRAKMHSLHVTWQPPPNHTQITGYKLSWQELDGEEQPNEEKPLINERIQQIKLRKRVKHHEVTDLGER